jgi:hypothetical protein
MNLNEIVALLSAPANTMTPVPTKDQARVSNMPWPPPLAQFDVPQSMILPGSAPIVPQGFSRK